MDGKQLVLLMVLAGLEVVLATSPMVSLQDIIKDNKGEFSSC